MFKYEIQRELQITTNIEKIEPEKNQTKRQNFDVKYSLQFDNEFVYLRMKN